MNCSEARDRILNSSIDDEVRAHVGECEACAELAATDGRLARALGRPDVPTPDPEGFDRVMQITADQDAQAVWQLRSLPTSRRIAIGLVAVLIGAIVYFLAWRRPDWGVYPMMQMAIVVVAMVIASAFGVVLSMPRSYRPRRPFTMRLALLIFLLLIPFVPALFPEAHHAHPKSVVEVGLLVGASKCFGLGTLAAFPALLGIRLLQREAELRLWPTIFAAVAAAIGANLALQLHCPIVDPGHLIVAHGMMGLMYAVLAWVVVKMTVK